jgi:hypothetical protein
MFLTLLAICLFVQVPQRTVHSRTLVSVISVDDASEASLDPVVIVENGKFHPPFAEYNEAAQKRFATEYFSAGKKYRVTFGGGEAGVVTIKEAQLGCNSLHASARAEVPANIRGRVMGLATNSDSIGKRAAARRAPTEAERSAVMNLVNEIYRARGTLPALLKRITTTNLTATDLDHDGNYELIGSFELEVTHAKARRDLLLIAEPQGQTFKSSLVHFQAYKLPAEGFDSAVDFVDQVDLDGDGVGEVFVLEHGFDAYGYSIYKKQNGRWRKVYSAMGDAC